MSESTSATRAAPERDDRPAARQAPQALQAVQVSLDRRDNGGDGAAMLDK
jgi:hypothetical protein